MNHQFLNYHEVVTRLRTAGIDKAKAESVLSEAAHFPETWYHPWAKRPYVEVRLHGFVGDRCYELTIDGQTMKPTDKEATLIEYFEKLRDIEQQPITVETSTRRKILIWKIDAITTGAVMADEPDTSTQIVNETDEARYRKALQTIHDILYMEGRTYNSEKEWDGDTLPSVAEVILFVFDGRMNLQEPRKRLAESTNELPEDHPEYTMEDWRQEVAEGNTRLGYSEWVAHRIEEEDDVVVCPKCRTEVRKSGSCGCRETQR